MHGAERSAIGLSHFNFITKDTTVHSLKVKRVEFLEHGPVKSLSLYKMTEKFETGANLVIKVSHRILSVKSSKSPLPEVLFIQFENCTRDNKNFYLFCYLESLVALGFFCDFPRLLFQLATLMLILIKISCTSHRLRQNYAVNMSDLVTQLRKSHAIQPSISHMLHIPNFSSLCVHENAGQKLRLFRNTGTFVFTGFLRNRDAKGFL